MPDAVATPNDDWDSLLIREPPPAKPDAATHAPDEEAEPAAETGAAEPPCDSAASAPGPMVRMSHLTLGVLLATVAVAAWALGAAMHGQAQRPDATPSVTQPSPAAAPVMSPPPAAPGAQRAAPATPASGAAPQARSPLATQPSAPISDQVWITKSGRKYHTARCRHARQGSPISRADALARGYTPCSQCNP